MIGAADVRIRPAGATAADQEALWLALFYAAHVDDDPGQSVEDARRNAALARYVADWGRPGDLALLAHAPDGAFAGAVWLRLHTLAERAIAEFVDEYTPELGLAVLPGGRGQGVGSRLLERAIACAQGRYRAIVLSVRDDNPARRLYERFGFVAVATIQNRVGTTSCKMLLTLASPPGPRGRRDASPAP